MPHSDPDRYAVIGNPIAQSKSPAIHGAFARQTGQDLQYTTINAPLDGLVEAVRAFQAGGGRGLNVTAPFKLQAYELATVRRERAEQAGATNALKFDGDDIVAENFDGIGLLNDLQRNQGVALAGRRILMLGAGGAARGALAPLLARRPATLVLCNRDVGKAQALARAFGAHGPMEACGYDDLPGDSFDIVFNATSASLTADSLPLPARAFAVDGLAYELAYGKGLTPFLQLARRAGVTKLADGVGMLVEQAAEAFVWWRGVRPDTRAVIAQMTVPLV